MTVDFLTTMADEDVWYIAGRLPKDIRDLMTQYPKLVLASGFIRAAIAGEEASAKVEIEVTDSLGRDLEVWPGIVLASGDTMQVTLDAVIEPKVIRKM